MVMSGSRGSVALALGAAALWSTAATAFELALRHVSVASVLFFACVEAALVLLALCAATGTAPLGAGTGPRGARMALHVALNPVAYYSVLFLAYERLPAQVALAANYTWAAALALVAVPVLGQSLGPRSGVALGLAYGGLLVVLAGAGDWGAPLDGPGLALGLGSAVIWALDWCLAAGDQRAGLAYLARKFAFATPALGLGWLVLDGRLPPTEAWGPILWVGAFELSLPFALWLAALRRAPSAARIATLAYLSPVMSLVWIRIVLGEPVPVTTPIGLAAIVGAALTARGPAPSPRPAAGREPSR